MLPRLFYLFLLFAFPLSTALAAEAGAGISRLQVSDPLSQKPMAAVVFFPSVDAAQVTNIGPYEIAASRDAAINEGRYPLILLSHGNMGSMWGHHDLATTLARKGYIVVSVMHSGDNFEDASRVGNVSSIYGRPKQISAALSAALEAAKIAPHIDPERIGFVGFSAGGTTGLILAGARPEFGLLENYCIDRPGDQGICGAKGRIEVDRPDLQPTADPRIRSFVLLAPVSMMFPAKEAQRVKAPVFIAVGGRDEELSPDANAIELAQALQSHAQLSVFPQAGHYTFLAPCSPELSLAAPMICRDVEGVDRAAFHKTLNAEIAAFFDRTLGIASR